MVSLAFVISFTVSAVAMLLGIAIYADITDAMALTIPTLDEDGIILLGQNGNSTDQPIPSGVANLASIYTGLANSDKVVGVTVPISGLIGGGGSSFNVTGFDTPVDTGVGSWGINVASTSDTYLTANGNIVHLSIGQTIINKIISTDGGVTFNESLLIQQPEIFSGQYLFHETGTDILYLSLLNATSPYWQQPNSEVLLMKSIDGGVTFGSPTKVADLEQGFCDGYLPVHASGNLVIVTGVECKFTPFNINGEGYSVTTWRSTDGGLTFDSGQTVAGDEYENNTFIVCVPTNAGAEMGIVDSLYQQLSQSEIETLQGCRATAHNPLDDNMYLVNDDGLQTFNFEGEITSTLGSSLEQYNSMIFTNNGTLIMQNGQGSSNPDRIDVINATDNTLITAGTQNCEDAHIAGDSVFTGSEGQQTLLAHNSITDQIYFLSENNVSGSPVLHLVTDVLNCKSTAITMSGDTLGSHHVQGITFSELDGKFYAINQNQVGGGTDLYTITTGGVIELITNDPVGVEWRTITAPRNQCQGCSIEVASNGIDGMDLQGDGNYATIAYGAYNLPQQDGSFVLFGVSTSDGGLTWTKPQQLTDPDPAQTFEIDNSAPQIEVSGAKTTVFVTQYGNDEFLPNYYQIGQSRTVDGGNSWSVGEGLVAFEDDCEGTGSELQLDAGAIDQAGFTQNLVAVCQNFEDGGLFIASSSDMGENWSAWNVLLGSNLGSGNLVSITCTNSHIYIVFDTDNGGNYDHKFMWSDDMGVSFSAPVTFDTGNQFYTSHGDIILGTDTEVYVGYNTYDGTQHALLTKAITGGGAPLAQPYQIGVYDSSGNLLASYSDSVADDTPQDLVALFGNTNIPNDGIAQVIIFGEGINYLGDTTTADFDSGLVGLPADFVSDGTSASSQRTILHVFHPAQNSNDILGQNETFETTKNIGFTVLGVLPVALFFGLFTILSPRTDGE